MDDLIDRVARSAGLDPDVAGKAVTAVLAFLAREGSAAETGQLLDALPGARAAVAGAGAPASTGMGIMGLAAELGELGLGMDAMGALARDVFAASREAVGEDATGAIVGSIPGLAQYV